jgi:hypothetical protein
LPDALADAHRRRRLQGGVCGSVTFDSARRIVTVCVGLAGPTYKLLDASTLEARATYTKPPSSDGIECLVLTAIDFRSGRTVFRRRAGTGVGFNDNYAPVTLGPDGSAYVGVISGLVRFK